jgi:hypothetical protein
VKQLKVLKRGMPSVPAPMIRHRQFSILDSPSSTFHPPPLDSPAMIP